ncbi:MAG: hypothetical protein Q4C52_13505 [Eubacteriales bacterium]|nr:hypothetical protein [Eubacteriales bacterium]
MPILNYTTTIDAFKTVSEIEYILMKHKAKSIMKNYEGETITAMSFLIDTGSRQIPVKMPVKIDECLKVLKKEKQAGGRNIKATREQAEKVAWRILKDWIEVQMALLDVEMVTLQEIFLPYIVDQSGQTVYEKLEQRQFLLEG